MRLPALIIAILSFSTAASAACDPLLAKWQRSGEPVHRDPIPAFNYEAAGDGHVFVGADGQLRMIYSGDDSGFSAIRLARGANWTDWQIDKTLLGVSAGHSAPIEKETAFYHRAPDGEHQIYFIGYADGETYEAEIYLAVADAVDGPYSILPAPVIPRGTIAGKDVHLITSPSVVTHDGVQHIAFLGWDGFEDVTRVWALGGTSTDNGRTWQDLHEVETPIGMEGQITPMPGGGYIAASTRDFGGTEGIGLACADHPFGPYTDLPAPALLKAGPPFETDEIIAAQITFDPETGAPHLYYTGAIHARGWWMMHATPAP